MKLLEKNDDLPQEKSALETPIITLAAVQNLTIYLINYTFRSYCKYRQCPVVRKLLKVYLGKNVNQVVDFSRQNKVCKSQ